MLRGSEENVRQVQDISRDNPLQGKRPLQTIASIFAKLLSLSAPEHIRLVIPPPEMPELEDVSMLRSLRLQANNNIFRLQILRKSVVAKDYFETQLLRELDYVLDVEADSNFPPHIYPEYSYLKSPFDHSQFIHKSGTCFVQVLGSGQGYLFLKNRLYLSHRQQKRPNKPSASTGGGGGTAPSTASMTASMMVQSTGSYLARTQSYYQAQQHSQELSEPQALKQQLQEICSSPDELNMRWENMVNTLLMMAAGNAGIGSSSSAGMPSSTVAPSEAFSLRSSRGMMRSADPTPADHPLPASLPPSSVPTPSLPNGLKGEVYTAGP